jgi:hypothetical protein
VAGLDEEADLPLEQLLARYGNYHLAAHAGGWRGGLGGSRVLALQQLHITHACMCVCI